jgi:imidazolonepropionase
MKTIIKNASQVVTVDTNGQNFKRGKELGTLNILNGFSILVEDGLIKDIVSNSTADKINVDSIIDAKDCIVLPGLVECHTHAVYSGSRANEYLMRLNGASYEEIAASAGGITSTMKSVRNSSFEELTKLLEPRINNFISQGVTTLEIKSGYGLSFYDEIKLLQVINHFKVHSSIGIVPTFLGAHIFPPEFKNDHKGYVNMIINEMLPYIIKNKLAEHVDAFCEATAFSSEEVDSIFTKAKKLGYKLRLHTEQFNNVGGLEIALKHKALSVDHLEVISGNDISKLAKDEIVSVLLPGASLFLDCPFAPARYLIDNNAIVALSTDFNPGSSHIANLQLVMQISALKMKMSVEEIISSVTINPAKAMGMSDLIGSIEIGKQADFSIFEANDISEIIYNIGINLNKLTIKKGEIVFQRN